MCNKDQAWAPMLVKKLNEHNDELKNEENTGKNTDLILHEINIYILEIKEDEDHPVCHV